MILLVFILGYQAIIKPVAEPDWYQIALGLVINLASSSIYDNIQSKDLNESEQDRVKVRGAIRAIERETTAIYSKLRMIKLNIGAAKHNMNLWGPAIFTTEIAIDHTLSNAHCVAELVKKVEV